MQSPVSCHVKVNVLDLALGLGVLYNNELMCIVLEMNPLGPS